MTIASFAGIALGLIALYLAFSAAGWRAAFEARNRRIVTLETQLDVAHKRLVEENAKRLAMVAPLTEAQHACRRQDIHGVIASLAEATRIAAS